MTGREQMRKYATEIADFLRRNKATLADTARHFGITDYAAKCRAERAMNMGLLDKNYFKRHMPSCKTQVWAWEMADYLMFHENASISDAAGYFNCGYETAKHYLREAITLGFLEERVYQKRIYLHQKNSAIEHEKKVVGLRRKGLSLEEIAQELGCSRQNVWRLLESAAGHGIIGKNKLARLNHRIINQDSARKKRWAYFRGIAGRIGRINSETYASLIRRHNYRDTNTVWHNEMKCLEELVMLKRLSVEDAGRVWGIMHHFRNSEISLSRLEEMAGEYKSKETTLRDLAIKYFKLPKSYANPAAKSRHFLNLAIRLGIMTQEEYRAKAAHNLATKPNLKRQCS